MRPLDGLVTTRTGSRCSRVGPAVTTTLFPCHGARCNRDRKSTRLNSSHGYISYAVFCLKKKKNIQQLKVPNTVHNECNSYSSTGAEPERYEGLLVTYYTYFNAYCSDALLPAQR